MAIQFMGKDQQATPIGQELVKWRDGLANDHASRAIVRRAASPTEVALTAPYQRLYRCLLGEGWPRHASESQNERLAAIVGLLAHVKEDDTRPIARTMSEASAETNKDRPPVSELRFRRLLDSPDADSLFVALRRVLPLIGHKVNVLRLADNLFYWGDKVKKEWAYEYYEWINKKST